MGILNDTCIACDVYRFTSFEEQKEILDALNESEYYDNSSELGLIIVRWERGNYGESWAEIQIIDKEEINL